MEAAFGGEEPAEVRQAFEGEAEEETEETPIATTSSSTLSLAMKCKMPPTESGPPPKRKGSHSVKGGICSLQKADCIYPTTADATNCLHAGVDPKFLLKRHSSSITKDAGYSCQYSEILKAEGKIVPECNFISSVKAQLSMHIHQFHLGATVTCYICQKKWWLATTWYEHMVKVHTDLLSKNYFVKEGTDIQEL